ncbi:ATP-binding protein [Algoriphagus sp. SE2]|uniref:sensor histidine kinase n=1 Tax=Algoriphagus sp. SE2 TaxID=3141536 RepID=UPI0031CD518D
MDFLLQIFAFRYLQKHEQTKTQYPEWVNLFFKGFVAALVFFIVQLVFDWPDVFLRWIAHIINFGIVYAAFKMPVFSPIKIYVNAFFPVVAIDFLEDLTILINSEFYNSYEGWFSTAELFAWIWLVAQFIINRRQRKALEDERIKAAQKEFEIKKSQKLQSELEIQVAERTSEINAQKEELIKTLNELKSMQSQLIHAEKMASLGELTAGIAHEIQNPLNFVNNFSELSSELLTEMKEEIDAGNYDMAKEIADDLNQNLKKIAHHGHRADSIVKGMLQHSRINSGEKELTDINALVDEFTRLSYHGLRAKDKSFNADFKLELVPDIPDLELITQDFGRLILNLVNNAFYAVQEKKNKLKSKEELEAYQPMVKIKTFFEGENLNITVEDNGSGIPQSIKEKIFQPFFTTKPTGSGTGLGLSLSYDIVKAHGGDFKVDSVEGEKTVFTISLPVKGQNKPAPKKK